ncbi:hypothetical protein F5051DRAFT_341652, partial [Lentinula edodes]
NFLKSNPQNTVEIAWCPGYKAIEGNKRADKLAKEAGKLWAPMFHMFTHAKQQAKAKALEDWKKEHARRPLRGEFALADGLPLCWKPRDYFNNTPREVYR